MSEKVFREYDQAELDAQYNNRARVPEHVEHFQRWQDESAAVRREFSCRSDIAYGGGPAETVDIFQARDGNGEAVQSGAPVNVFFHGGYWIACDKRDFSFIARSMVPAGCALVMVNYGLIPSVTMDQLVEQCRRALKWVHANAHTFGGDGANLHLSGHSAGGQLVAMLLADPDSPPISSAASISGLFELEPVRLSYINETLGLDEASAGRNSPLHMTPAQKPPLLLAWGGRESEEFHRQNMDFAAEWERHRVPCRCMNCGGADHFTILDHLTDGESGLARAVLAGMGLD